MHRPAPAGCVATSAATEVERRLRTSPNIQSPRAEGRGVPHDKFSGLDHDAARKLVGRFEDHPAAASDHHPIGTHERLHHDHRTTSRNLTCSRLWYVDHGDGEGLFGKETAGIGAADPDLIGGLGFVGKNGRSPQPIAVDREQRVVRVPLPCN